MSRWCRYSDTNGTSTPGWPAPSGALPPGHARGGHTWRMGNSARRRRARLFALAVTAVCVTATLVLDGCASGSATGTPDATRATAQATASAATGQAAACNPDYCRPADWDTARAD